MQQGLVLNKFSYQLMQVLILLAANYADAAITLAKMMVNAAVVHKESTLGETALKIQAALRQKQHNRYVRKMNLIDSLKVTTTEQLINFSHLYFKHDCNTRRLHAQEVQKIMKNGSIEKNQIQRLTYGATTTTYHATFTSLFRSVVRIIFKLRAIFLLHNF